MRIVQANKFYYLKGGAERYYFNLIKLLESKGHEIIPFSMQDEKNEPSEYSKYFVSNVDFDKKGQSFKKARRVLYSLEAKKKFEQLICSTKPDLIHIHNIYHQISPSILTIAKKYKIPVVETLHDFKLICPNYTLYSKNELCEQCKKYRYYKCALRKCIKNKFWQSLLASKEMYFHKFIRIYENNVNQFLAPSKFVYDKILKFGIIKPDQITILPEFIFDSTGEGVLSFAKSSQSYILYFGRLIKEKGIKTLINAMKQVKGLELHLAGTGPDEQEFKDLVKKENLNNIKFFGFLDQEKLQQEISNSLFVIHPSEVYETFGLSILENYVLNKPVIASNLGALPEIVKDKQTGLLFKAGDSQDLADKINYLANNQDLAKQMGDNAKILTEQKYSSDDHYQKIIKIYEGLL
ncbi:MAG: glycosyltransferase family 4 protein [Patescibacteria group bacterium]|jgi:glycosyltransferase involved in cell wall biosynthesis